MILLQPLLEVAAVAGAGDHAGQLELDHPLAGQRLRHVVVHDALGEALHDRGLADAGLADQHRVVLGPAGQDLDGLLDLVVAADHRVDLALAGQRGQVRPELVQRGRGRPAAGPRPSGGRALAGQARLQRLGVTRPAASIRPAADSGFSGQREQDVLGPDVGGAHRAGDLVRVQQRPLGARGELRRLQRLASARGLPAPSSGAASASGSAPAPASRSRGGSRCAAAQSRWSVSRSAALLGGPPWPRRPSISRASARHQPGDVDPVSWAGCRPPRP